MSNQKLAVYGLFLSLFLLAYSSNPPNGLTGAPGEGTCANCHIQGSSGGLGGSISISGLPGTITPNATYPLVITVFNNSVPLSSADRAGFEVVALDGNNGNAGTFSSPGAGSTLNGSPKNYWKHSMAKSFGGGGSVTWTVNWKAPASAPGNVINMYYAGIIADNGNNTNSNDYLVTNSSTGSIMGATITIAVTSKKNPSCNGGNDGMITVAPSGGQMPYTYSWSNGGSTASISNLVAGTYTVIVTDNNNTTAESTITLTDPPAIGLDLVDKTDLSCYGKSDGKISISTSGGTGNRTVKWSSGPTSNTITNLKAGMYTVTVTDGNNCKLVGSYFITEPDSLKVNAIIVQPSCTNSKNGKITLQISGGTAPYDYIWNPNQKLDSLVQGSYRFTITDHNSCTKVVQFELRSKDSIAPKITVKPLTLLLDSLGKAVLDPKDAVLTVSDNCDVSFIYRASKTNFNCADLTMPVKVYIDVEDNSKNVVRDSIFVTVQDRRAPVIDCNVSYNKWNCNEKIPTPIHSDNCGIKEITLLSTNQKIGDVLGYGKHILTYSVTDHSGNTNQCSTTIEIDRSATINVDTIIQKKCPSDGIDIYLKMDVNTEKNLLILNTDTLHISRDSSIIYNSKKEKIALTIIDSFSCIPQQFEINYKTNWDSVLQSSIRLVQPSTNSSADGEIHLIFKGGVAPYTFTLIDSSGNIIEKNNTASFTKLRQGSYFVVLMDAQSCTYSFGYYELKFTSATNHYSASKVYCTPNPFQDNITIFSESNIHSIVVSNQDGKIFYQTNLLKETKSHKIDTKSWTMGIYYIQTIDQNGKRQLNRVIK